MKKLEVNKWDLFWRYTVILETEKRGNSRMFTCKCECWTIRDIQLCNLRSWHSQSCWCLNKEILKAKTWDKNPAWKWWISSLSNSIRTSNEYKDWRTACYERDNYTCQVTWIKGNWNLVVHHLNPFHIIIADIEWAWEADENIFDINNWITILESVHMDFHNKYWYTNFTKEDFYEFSKN